MRESNPQFVRIFLGLATEEERRKAAEQVLLDDRAYEDMAAQEQSLIDDYISGALEPDEAAALEAHAQLNQELTGRIRIQRTLAKTAKEKAAPVALRPSSQDARARTRGLPYWARIAAMLILIATPLVYLSYAVIRERTIAANQLQNWRVQDEAQRKMIDDLHVQLKALQDRAATASSGHAPESSPPDATNTEKELHRQIEELTNRLSTLDQQSATSDHSGPSQLAFMILPENRGDATHEEMAVASTVNLVDLQFNLDNPGRFSAFSLTLSSAGRPVLEQHRLKARLVGQRWAVSVYVPVDALHSGSYDAVLLGVNGAEVGPIGNYHFQISRKE